jgi:plasmid stabilization system protein ParE
MNAATWLENLPLMQRIPLSPSSATTTSARSPPTPTAFYEIRPDDDIVVLAVIHRRRDLENLPNKPWDDG